MSCEVGAWRIDLWPALDVRPSLSFVSKHSSCRADP